MDMTLSSNFLKMTRRTFLAISLCFLLGRGAVAQGLPDFPPEQEPLYSLAGNFKLFAVDNLHNLYVLSPADEVQKYNADGQRQFNYPNSTLGNIAAIDVSNPLLIMLFFPDYQQVLLLDRTLSPAGQFNLFRAGLLQVSAVGMASDNRLWAYDAATFQLKKIDQNAEVLLESADLSLELGHSVKPLRIFEKNQTVFLCDPTEGILVFDVFGTYLKTLQLKAIADCQVLNDELYYLEKGQLKAFNLKSLTGKVLKLPEGLRNPKQVRIVSDRLYVLDEEGVKVFRLE